MNCRHVNYCPECSRPIHTLDAPAIALLFLASQAPVVCVGCGAIMKLDGPEGLAGLDPAEIDRLLEDQDWMRSLAAVPKPWHFLEPLA